MDAIFSRKSFLEKDRVESLYQHTDPLLLLLFYYYDISIIIVIALP